MSPKTTPNAKRPSADRLAAFPGRATVSSATLDKGPTPAIVEVLHSGRSRSTWAICRQADRLHALFSGRPSRSRPARAIGRSLEAALDIFGYCPAAGTRPQDG